VLLKAVEPEIKPVKKAATFSIDNSVEFKIKMLNWANQFNIFCLLDNQQYNFDKPAFECLLAAGCKQNITLESADAFERLAAFSGNISDWLFGHFCYDVKDGSERLGSSKFDGIGFPDVHFFVPEIVLELNGTQLTIFYEQDAQNIFREIDSCCPPIERTIAQRFTILNRISHDAYIAAIKKIQAHILRGDCYELNFCQEFYAENVTIEPVAIYRRLTQISPNPFSAFYKLNDKYCICASPERYLKKHGNKLFSQPIKGTATRNLLDAELDERNKRQLLESKKEQSENVMVVDLVRNDLSKVCKEGTVKVEELFEIYSFPQLHHMISTISGEVKVSMNWVDIIRATFPMGSMTGAPKKRVMELIEKYEQTKRGLFSGTIGYVKPNGDFDFNVVIRSILYNEGTNYLSFQAGSAITFYSDAEKEYEECLLKAAAIKKVLDC
jgi:para-aminobenzoate synthetase component 1